jgi:hypothetical protein
MTPSTPESYALSAPTSPILHPEVMAEITTEEWQTMQIAKSRIQNSWTLILILVLALVWVLSSGVAAADAYSDSAHGNTSYGVNRSGTQYDTGECAHCHDTFAQSICGVNEFILFAPYDSTSQTDNFCFQCHKDAGSVQDPVFYNYNYSYRASGDTSITCPTNVLEAFSFIDESGSSVSNCGSIYGTSHKLTDIKNFINSRWGYTADSNPCTACHNPHPAQRDLHTASSRGRLVSLPSSHTDTSTWQLWGDDAGERMGEYSTYQAPNAASGYEPDGSDTIDGSNLTDYVTFCTDCHNATNETIWSTTLNDYLKTIDWTTEKHGGGAADDDSNFEGEHNYSDVLPPYEHTQCGSYILACTDCHEAHGSPNIFLTRQKVNNGDVTVKTGTGWGPDGRINKEWVFLCGKCHEKLLYDGPNDPDRHPHPGDIDGDEQSDCTVCHMVHSSMYIVCTECHYHGSGLGAL